MEMTKTEKALEILIEKEDASEEIRQEGKAAKLNLEVERSKGEDIRKNQNFLFLTSASSHFFPSNISLYHFHYFASSSQALPQLHLFSSFVFPPRSRLVDIFFSNL